MGLPEIAIWKSRVFLTPQHVEELDSWQTHWLLNCPVGEERCVLIIRDETGKIVMRECLLDRQEVKRRLSELQPHATLMSFGRL